MTPTRRSKVTLTLPFLLLTPISAQAEIVRVQTGEHSNFTRLAFVFEEPTPWRAGRTETGYGIAFDREGVSINLTGAFRLIPRDRVADLTWAAEAGELQISSECECYLDVFELPGNTLVADIRSGQPPVNASFEAPLNPEEPVEMAMEDPPESEMADKPPTPAFPSIFDTRRPAVALPEFTEQTPAHDLSALEEELVEAIGAAASEGLLALQLPQGNAAPAPSSVPKRNADRSDTDVLAHIRSRTSSATIETPEQKAARQLLESCPAPSEVDVASWGKGNAQQTLAESRSQLFDDLGRLDRAAVIETAKSLVYLGFGVEADNVLKLLDQRTVQTDLLRDLAAIMDDIPDRTPRVLVQSSACPSAAALWGLIAGTPVEEQTNVDGAAIQRSFMQLPQHLQRLVGVRVIEALREKRLNENAEAIFAALRRMPGAKDPKLAALVARDKLNAGDTRGGEAALGTVIRSASEATPDALLALLKAREERQATVPEDMILLAESLAQESRGTPVSRDLLDAAARAHARDGRFEIAYEIASGLGRRTSELQRSLISDLTKKLAARAPDNLFLLISFQQALMLPDTGLDDDAARAMAQRLLDLGFLAEADGLIQEVDDDMSETRFVRARIAFAKSEPDRALDYLDGILSREASSLRAEIRASMGKLEEAANLYSDLGEEGSAASAAWQSGDHSVIETYGQPEQQAFVRSLDGEDGVPLPEKAERAAVDLSQNNLRVLLEGTSSFREAARALLDQEQNSNQ